MNIFYLYVFASRNESIAFNELLRNRHIVSTLIATPRECMTGCGLSVRVNENYLKNANFLLQNFKYKYTYKGLFRMEKYGIKTTIYRVK